MTGEKQKVDTVRLQNLSYGHKASGTLKAAMEMDLFTKISEGASDFGKAAEALGISELNAERLMVACASLGLLEKNGQGYCNSPDVERFLVKGKKTYVGPWLQLTTWDFENWNDVSGVISEGRQPKILGFYEELTEEFCREYHEKTYSVGLGAGFLFSRDVDMSNRQKILDLGGGSGCYCIAAISKYPQLTAVVFDFPQVCAVTREYVAQWGLSEKISTNPGDLNEDPLPSGADVMIMASNLPHFGAEALVEILTKAYEALEPGGEFHLVGETLNDDKTGPMGPALWGLHEVILGSYGRSHSESEVKSYLEKAGFQDVRVNPFIPGSLTRICGHKKN